MFISTISLNFLTEPIEFMCGKNAKENQELVLMSDPGDLWFHLEDGPSAHLVLKTNDLSLNKKQIKKIAKCGAMELKKLSKSKNVKKLPIHYTYISNVETTDTDGLVIIKNFKSIII